MATRKIGDRRRDEHMGRVAEDNERRLAKRDAAVKFSQGKAAPKEGERPRGPDSTEKDRRAVSRIRKETPLGGLADRRGAVEIPGAEVPGIGVRAKRRKPR